MDRTTDPNQIKHFLLTLKIASGELQVESFGFDYEAALRAYARAERASFCNPSLDIVLLSADSLETIKQTHSSYFSGTSSAQLEELLAN